MANGMNAPGAATSPAKVPGLRRTVSAGLTHLRHHPMAGHDTSGHHAQQKLVVPAAGPDGGKTGISPSESCSRALALRTQPVGRWPVHRTGVRHRASPAAARAGRPHADAARSDPASTPATSLASPQPHAITIPSASPATPDPTRRPRRRGPVRLVTNPAPPAARFLPGCGHGLRRHRYSPARLQAYAAHKGPDRRRGQRANVPPPRF